MVETYKEFLEKIKKELESGEIKLLGQIKVSEDEYLKLKEYVSDFVLYSSDYSNPKPDIKLALFLVQVAIKNYEGRYWKQLINELGLEIPVSKQTYMGKTFAETIEYYKLFKLGEEYSSQQYVENIKAHAFVTNFYMDGFFEFAYAFFENNLFRQVPENKQELLEDIELLSMFMEHSLASSSDSITNGTNRAAKSYKLLKSTRRVFAQCDVSAINSFFYPIMRLIDDNYYDDKLPNEGINRFNDGFVTWCEKKADEFNREGRKSRDRVLTNKRPYVMLDPNRETAKLIIPPQKFRPSDCDSGAFVIINNGENSVERELELWNSFGINISESIEVDISDVFEEIRISFSNVVDKEYVISARPYRIVNDDWQVLNNLKVGNNIILVQKDVECFWNQKCEIIFEENEYVKWNYFSVDITTESVCQIGRHTLSIAGEYSSEPVFDSLIKAFTVKTENGDSITATYRHPYISFEVDNEKLSGTVLFINGEMEAVRDIDTKGIYPISDQNSRCAVTIDVNELKERLDGRYRIDIDIPGEGRKTICDYLILRQFKYRFDCKMNIYRDCTYLDVTSWLHWCNGNPEWMTWENNRNSVTFEVPIDADQKNVDINLYLYENLAEKYIVSIPIGVFSYGFSAEEKKYLKDDYIWYGNITNVLYIRNNLAKTAQVYYGKESDSLYNATRIKDGIFAVDISEIGERIRASSYTNHYINVIFDEQKDKSIALPRIMRKVEVHPKYNIEYIDDRPCILVHKIMGDAKPFIKVYEHNTDNCIIERLDIHEGANYLEGIPSKGLYDVVPCMEEGDELGLFSEITEFNKIWSLGRIDTNDLVGKSLRVKGINYDGGRLELRYHYYAEVQSKQKDDVYVCYLKEVPHENGKNDWRRASSLGAVKIAIINKDDNLNCKIKGYSGDDEKWMSLFYDRKTKRLLRPDSKVLLATTDYSRFYSLDEDITDCIIDKNNIKVL